jgi:membrane-bound acyltransferase YfiQ involved in biofilm formation
MSDAIPRRDGGEAHGDGRRETEKERLDRNLLELLNELRVALPGVQVLFAFLLAVPFQSRWDEVTAFQRDVYFATLCCALVATALMIAPTAYHRLNFRARRKRELVMISNRLAIAGITFLAIALVGVMVLIADILFGAIATAIFGALAALLFFLLWFLLPKHKDLGVEDDD